VAVVVVTVPVPVLLPSDGDCDQSFGRIQSRY